MDKEINITLEDINIWLFHKIVTTGDTSLLEVSNHNEVWESLVEKYQELVGKSSNAYLWTLRLQIERLRNQLTRCYSALKIVYYGAPIEETKQKFIDLLKNDKIKVVDLTTDEYDKHIKYLKALEVKMKIRAKELESLAPKTESKKVEWDLTKELFTLSRILDLKYKLNAKETSVKEYLIIVNEAKKAVSNGK